MIRPSLTALLLVVAPIWAAPPRPVVVNAVTDLYRPLPPDQERLGGMIAARLRANSEGYIERFAASENGHTVVQNGILLDAAVSAFEFNRQPHVSAVMLSLLRKIIAAQGADGYVGPRLGSPNWIERDTWGQSAALQGVLSYYRVTGDGAALSTGIKLGNLLAAERRKSKDADIFAGALQPMVQLYRYTDEQKYIEFCTAVAEAWFHAKPPQLSVSYGNLEILNGLVDLYRVTGDNSFFKMPLQTWTDLRATAFTLTGVPATTSHGGSTPLDACTTEAWLQLTANLFRITGQAVYAEQLERTVYNQLFAGQDERTGTVLAPVAWTAKKQPANDSACAVNQVRGLTQLPSVVSGRYGAGIAVNLYTAARATVRLRRRGTIQLYVETNYPESGTVLLHVEPDHPLHFPLRLRVPEWTSSFTADVGQDHLVGRPGDFLILNRSWKRGDTVRIAMSMNTRTIPGIGEYSADVAIARGPQILALGKGLNPEITNFDAVTVDSLDPAGLQVTELESNFGATWMGDQAYTIAGTYAGQPRKLVLVPFADARNYRVWLAQSKASSGASGR